MRKDEDYLLRSKLLKKLGCRDFITEEELNEVFSYNHLEYHANPDTKKVTQKVFSSSDLGEKFRLLKRLNGVGVIVATSVLMFQNPHKYAELSPACWNNLIKYCGLQAQAKDGRSDYNIPEYLNYLEVLKSVSNEFGMNVGDTQYVLSKIE
jgi:hypothetical protein